MKRPWLFPATISVIALLVLGAGRAKGEFQFHGEDGFEPDEEVESLTVRITVGADGEDVSEPVALDLGLGFPLWLHPLGRLEGETAPYGAVPQQATAENTATAGSVVEFAFELAGEAGQDTLQATSQLLAGVRLADISRIGFMSRGESNWVLEAYEIEINGNAFTANDEVNASVETRHEAARTRLGEIAAETSLVEVEAENLRMLVEAGMATDEHEARLEEINTQLQPLTKEQKRLERQMDGTYPWFEEPEFNSPWRTDEAVQQVRVMLVTASHPGADTQNHVYYRAGGHKYLLSSPMNPLSAEEGLRIIPLDVIGGPLTAADLRGHALGMLAHEQPYGEAPDRWHPERLLVEVDGSVVYDSDEKELDRLSLDAIRIIPPAHFNEAAAAVANEPIERESFLWEAGSGQGLDLAGGGAAALPEVDDPIFPPPEPGLTFDEELYASAEESDGLDGFQPFPGEEDWYEVQDETDLGSGDVAGDWGSDGCGCGGCGCGGCGGCGCGGCGGGAGGWGGSGGWGGGFSWGEISGVSWPDLIGIIEQILDQATGSPAGEPVQVPPEGIRIVYDGAGWEVRWEVYGDTSEVTGYEVSFAVFEPHSELYTVLEEAGGTVHASQHYFSIPPDVALEAQAAIPALPGHNENLAYVQPLVAPVIAGVGEPLQAGAARPLSELLEHTHLVVDHDGGWFANGGVTGWLDDLPPGFGSYARRLKEPIACRGYLYDAPHYGHHLEFTLDPTLHVSMAAELEKFGVEAGEWNFVGHVGFRSEVGGNTARLGGGVNSDLDANVPVNVSGIENSQPFQPIDESITVSDGANLEWRPVLLSFGGIVEHDQPVLVLGPRFVRP